MKTTTMAGLTTRLVGGTDGEGGGDGPLVVLLHGFGAPGDDLVPLADVLPVPPGTRWAFPAAPLKLPGGWGGESRAWWMIDMAELEEAMEAGRERDMSRRVPAGLVEARAQISALLGELEQLGPGPRVLGGFSQGAMLSCDVALHTDRALAGLVMMSGTYLAEDQWQPRMKARAGLRVFQSHGTRDPLLPHALAERLRDDLGKAGARIDWVSFRGAHEIPREVLVGLSSFLNEVGAKK